MTRLPTESRNIQGLEGQAFPRYRVGPLCSMPLCSRPVDHVHHITRRSFLNGDFAWVRLPDGSVAGNLTGLDVRCHQEITENRAAIGWDPAQKKYVWIIKGEIIAPLVPQPPLHGEPFNAVTSHTAPGPAAVERCGSCGRPLPHQHDEKREAPRRRKTWVVSCPDDGEDGGVVLDTLLDGCRDLFSHDENKATRYFTLVQALALVVQHGHLMVGEGVSE